MKLFMKCLKEVLWKHFGEFFYKAKQVLVIVVPILALILVYCMVGLCFVNILCTYFHIEDIRTCLLVAVGYAIVSYGVLYILIETFELMSREKKKG